MCSLPHGSESVLMVPRHNKDGVGQQMSESVANTEAQPQKSADDHDWAFTIAIVVLVISILAVGAWLGYSVYAQKQLEAASSPAMRALGELADVVKQYPNDAAVRVRYAEALATAAKYDQAMEQLRNAIKIDPEHGGAYLDMGLVAMAQQEYPAAERYFKKVVDLTEGKQFQDVSDRREAALYNLGVIAVADERWEDAVGYLKGALRIRKDASDTYLALAQAYRGLDEPDKAIENITIALAFDPNYAEARYELGKLYLEVSNEPSAAVELRRSLDLAPDADPANEALESLGPIEERIAKAEAAFEQGDFKEALGLATIAVALDPSDPDALMVYGLSRENTGDRVGAIMVYRSVLENDAKNTAASEALDRLNAE